jgi:amino acid adenylation domain-containing protein
VDKDKKLMQASFGQVGLWLTNQIVRENPVYSVPTVIRLTGKLDIAALEKALSEIARRHETLRTVFGILDGMPMAVIGHSSFHGLQESVLGDSTVIGHETSHENWVTDLIQEPFDMVHGPLFKASLLTLNKEEYIFAMSVHHIIFDEWSVGIFFRELKELYEAELEGREPMLEELPIQYGDYAVWQREWLQGEVLEKLVSYWKQKLAGLPGLELPSDHPRPAIQTFQGRTRITRLDKELSRQLKELARHEGVTLNMLMLAVFDVLLYRYTQQEDIAVGMPISNRNRVELENLIGFFLNTLVIRTDLSGEPTFRELLQRVKETLLEAYEHQELPFEKLVEVLNPERDLSRTPLFQIMFVMANASLGVETIGDLTVTPMRIETETSKFDLTMFVEEQTDCLDIAIEYSTDLFDADRIERMAGHYQCLLADIVGHPEKKIWELELLTEAEKQQILVEWNDTAADYPQDKCVHQLFEEQVERTPDAIAVVFEDQQLTYRELNERANQLGHYLQKLGVGPEVLVGICVERSLEMMVGLLGILKAGGAYVPLDPSYPKERLQFMLEDTQASILLTHTRVATGLALEQTRVVYLDRDWKEIGNENIHNLESAVKPDNLVYIIYTSGSTGKPKGVMICHQGLVNYLYWIKQNCFSEAGQGTLVHSSFAFDLIITSLYTPLLTGLPVILLSDGKGVDALADALRKEGDFSLIKLTPTHLGLLEQQLSPNEVEGRTKTFVIGGEPLLGRHIRFWQTNAPKTQLINHYGPTETVVGACVYPISSIQKLEARIPIGKPIANTQLYILDSHLRPLPAGIPGQLYIGGAGVARGYLNRPELTAEKFIQNPFALQVESRMYKTGDLASRLPDGNIEFLGRMDSQVKVRGYRVELGEIEAVLSQHSELKEIAVLSKEDESGTNYLVAYLVARQTVTISELKRFLQKKLPEYMHPSHFIFLDAIPLTANGKINRRVLPEPSHVRPKLTESFVPPHTPTEEALAKICADVLGIESVGMNDNLFELGCHSLLAVKISMRIQKNFQVRLPLHSLFESPFVSSLSQLVDELKRKSSNNPLPLVKIDRKLNQIDDSTES